MKSDLDRLMDLAASGLRVLLSAQTRAIGDAR